MDVQLEDYVPSFELLEALSDAMLLRASGRPGPPCLIGFWNIPWLEADDTHKSLTQVVSADFREIVVSYAVFTEDRRGALPWKALMHGICSRPVPRGFWLEAQSSDTGSGCSADHLSTAPTEALLCTP